MDNVSHERRSPAETLWLHLLLHLGFSKSLLSEAHLRPDSKTFGRRSIERAFFQIDGRLAYQRFRWPTRPANKMPGRGVTSRVQLLEISLLATSMFYLYGERIYESLQMDEIIQAFDLYTNIRKVAGDISPQLAPDTVFWLSRELISHCAVVPYCPGCEIRYYSATEQKIRNRCPFCKEVGIGDFDSPMVNMGCH